MPKTTDCFLLAAIAAASMAVSSPSLAQGPEPARFYVATNGNDAWSGTLAEPNAEASDGPFATLERARDAIRSLKQNGGLLPAGVDVLV
ncbi:MAG: hypothetical protein JXR94_00125, partial [Candidatus Hydrogenedentes bacterium]|nr:hypothetical protein [Candidatus Hydrogenedentota bacterium]